MDLISYLSGILGENRACAFLKKHRFGILERNFHSRFGEIDVIVKKGEILHFVEIKFAQKDYEPYERLGFKKYNKILKTIEFYKLRRQISNNFQLNLICIKDKDVEFFENISL